MTQLLFESIARIARHEAEARAVAAAGKVVEVFPAGDDAVDHAVSVELRDTKLLLPRVAIAVGALGFAALPPVGALVMVVFLDGDPNAPVVVGRLYHPDEDPPKHEVGQIVLRLPSGTAEPKLSLEVRGDAPSVSLALTGDLHLELKEQEAVLRVGEGDDALQLSITGAGGGRAELRAGGTRLLLRKDGDVELTTTGDLKLEGANVTIAASQKLSLSGAEVEVN